MTNSCLEVVTLVGALTLPELKLDDFSALDRKTLQHKESHLRGAYEKVCHFEMSLCLEKRVWPWMTEGRILDLGQSRNKVTALPATIATRENPTLKVTLRIVKSSFPASARDTVSYANEDIVVKEPQNPTPRNRT